MRTAAAYALTQCAASAGPLWDRWAVEAGQASGQFADEIAAVAARYPETAGQVAFTAEYAALNTPRTPRGIPVRAGPALVTSDA